MVLFDKSSSSFFLCSSVIALLLVAATAFQTDELLVDDEEFGLEGGQPRSPDLHTYTTTNPSTSSVSTPPVANPIRKRLSDSDSDSKIQFTLDHAFGDSDYSPAGTFSARLKTSNHGIQTLTKIRFSRNAFLDADKQQFTKLLEADGFYRIRLPSNVLSQPGRDYIVSSVKARCLPREGLDEHFVIHMEGVNILAVNYGVPGSCSYPRQLKLPTKWSFNSHTFMKSIEQAPRAPIFAAEDILLGDNGEEVVKPPEKSFWAKYWMYLIPLGLIVMNAITQAMNLPEEQVAGQPGVQGQQHSASAIQRGPNSAVRRR